MDCADAEIEVNPDVTVGRKRGRERERERPVARKHPPGFNLLEGWEGGLRCEARSVVAD
jgi:hypothetical protein